MEPEPLVSVIIPTYNRAHMIGRAVTSALQQCIEGDEVIVVDDGSTDATEQALEQYQDRIHYIRISNSGAGPARNRGIHEARNELIAFLDSDDILLESSVEERVDYLNSHPDIGWVFTDAVEYTRDRELGLFLDQFPWLDLEKDQFVQLLRGIYPLTSTVMVRRSLLTKVGGFNVAIDYGEDIELFMRLLLVSKVGMIKKPLSRRLIHPGQGVSSTFDRWNSRVGIYGNFNPSVGAMSVEQARALKKELKRSRFKLGECYWEAYEMARARSCFLASLGFNRWTAKAIVYSTLSLLPVFFLRAAREAKSGN